jgi:hypothetical protein
MEPTDPRRRVARHRATAWLLLLGAGMAVTGCVTLPTGPSVMVLPGSGKPFEQFQADDALCRQWALRQTGIAPGEAAQQSGVGSAVVGTLVGAGLGAAIGAAAGNPALGAAAGAGAGLFGGSAVGANAANASGAAAQSRYDIAYQQCMYAKGNQIPGAVQAPRATRSSVSVVPPPPPPRTSAVPPPPPPRLSASPVPAPPPGYPPPGAPPPPQ